MRTFRVRDERVDKDGSFLFQLPSSLFDKAAQNAVDSRVMQSEILADLQLLGFKLAASFDIGIYRTSSDIETWVIQRTNPTEGSCSMGLDGEHFPPSYDHGELKDDGKKSK